MRSTILAAATLVLVGCVPTTAPPQTVPLASSAAPPLSFVSGVQVLPPPARYAAAGLALEAAGKITIVDVDREDALRICNGSGACSFLGVAGFCRITISTHYEPDFRAAMIDHERAHCGGWPANHPP